MPYKQWVTDHYLLRCHLLLQLLSLDRSLLVNTVNLHEDSGHFYQSKTPLHKQVPQMPQEDLSVPLPVQKREHESASVRRRTQKSLELELQS